jgi:sarcosine oxidase delta subunit
MAAGNPGRLPKFTRRQSSPNVAKLGTVQNPLRFTDILAPRRMKHGVQYESWRCKSETCERPIAPKRQGLDRPTRVLSVKCPHCGTVQEHTWQGLELLRYEPPK